MKGRLKMIGNIIKRKIFLNLCLTIILLCAGCSENRSYQDEAEYDDTKAIAMLYGNKILMRDKDNLIGIILGGLLNQYAKNIEVEATKEEIEAFISKGEKQKIEMRKDWGKRRDELLKKLEEENIPESEKKELVSDLEMFENLLNVDEELESFREREGEKIKKMQEELAKSFIRRWKINQALFRQYGGRVIFQQAGPEPIDAYYKFLKEEEKKGNFKILDRRLKKEFWDYFINDDIHTFISQTTEQGKKVFETNWFLMDKPIEK